MISVNLNKLFPSIKTKHLPKSVKKAIAEQQVYGRQIACWCRLVVAFLFILLYILAPKVSEYASQLKSSDDFFVELVNYAEYRPVFIAIGFYFIHAIFFLWLSHRKKNKSFGFLEITIDFMVLYLLIWTFHLDYQQPPSFYLKAPTLLYVFIFICMQGARFEVSHILFAGFCGCTGWIAMTLYAYIIQTHEALTTSYITYITSNKILIGAEVDKIFVIVVVTGLAALTVIRAKQLMVAVVIEGSVARSLSRFVPTQVTEDLVEQGSVIDMNNVKATNATIMFTDIQGFTSYSEINTPKTVISTLNAYFKELEKVISSYKGIITQFQGDAIVASFNLPIDDPQHAANAVRAAIEIIHLKEKGLVPFVTRVGINTGDIVGGLVGSGERLTYTIHGDHVNLASRLEQLNKTYNTYILAAEDTVSQAGNEFNFEAIGEIKVRGRQSKVTIYTTQ